MYGENGAKLRAELAVLLRQHRIQQRLGGPGTYTVPVTTTAEERQGLGEQIARYRHAVLLWCRRAVRTADTRSTLAGPGGRARDPAQELRGRLEAAVHHSTAGLPTTAELTTEQAFPIVETWRQAARAATLGEHDFDALDYGGLSPAQCMTVLKDAAEVARAVVGLDRRYANIPGWQPLKNRARLGRAAEACALLAGRDEPDYTVDLRGWHPPPTLISGPAQPGLPGVLQAEHNLLVHLATFPDARSLRLVLESQRLVSRSAAALVATSDPDRGARWRTREATYQQLVRGARDLGGRLGNGGPAAGQGALAASRLQRLTGTDLAAPAAVRRLDRLFAAIDERLCRVIEHGAEERLYFLRIPLPRLDHAAPGLVKPARGRYVPVTGPVQTDLISIVRTRLHPQAVRLRAPKTAAQSRTDFEAAIVHRPPGRPEPGLGL